MAKTIAEFMQYENDRPDSEEIGAVRISMHDKTENYFDVYGEPEGYVNRYGKRISAEKEREELSRLIDRTGCVVVDAELWDGRKWGIVDSIGMNVGYDNACDPTENYYVPDLMRAALNARAKLLSDIGTAVELAEMA